MARRTRLTVPALQREAAAFSNAESKHDEPSLFGVTDGKAVGTYLEHKFRGHLKRKHVFKEGSSAQGIDFPELGVDMKVTSARQPQSSCPFKSARQKIYGLGYAVLVFVYDKTDNPRKKTARLKIVRTLFVEDYRTADYQMTRAIRDIIDRSGNEDDMLAYFADRNLPVDDIVARELAKEVFRSRPRQGYLTISNALQWRLQYRRVVDMSGTVEGVLRIT
jgi:hypothetical protein